MSKQFYFKQFSSALVPSLNVEIVLFQVIQFSISTHFSSIGPIDRVLSGATTLGQSGSGSNGNEGVLYIPQSSSITGTSPLDFFSVIFWTLVVGVLPLCRGEVYVFYSPSQLGNSWIFELIKNDRKYLFILKTNYLPFPGRLIAGEMCVSL